MSFSPNFSLLPWLLDVHVGGGSLGVLRHLYVLRRSRLLVESFDSSWRVLFKRGNYTLFSSLYVLIQYEIVSKLATLNGGTTLCFAVCTS